MLVVEGFQKFAGIPFGMSRIFESLMPQQIGTNRCRKLLNSGYGFCSTFKRAMDLNR
jgi:hypothetical protein